MTEKKIILNRIRTPDGTVLTSKHGHDMQSHQDANGETYFVDGGNEYLRRSINDEPYFDLSLYDDESFDVIRQNVTWGTRGPRGDQPLKQKPLMDLDDDHIQAILDTQKHISQKMRRYLHLEQEFRKSRAK